MTPLLQDWVRDQAERNPDAIAVVLGTEALTYGQLDGESNRLARMLKDVGCDRGDRVCFLMPKSISAIISLLAILKADCTYVPLDAGSPAPRLARMVETCEPRCILAIEPAGELLGSVMTAVRCGPSIRVGWLGQDECPDLRVDACFTRTDLAACSSLPVDCENTAADPAYLLFTSGSTGVPKGVVISHANVWHFVQWATKYFGITEADRLSGHSPLHFDLSMFDLFGALAAGAQLHVVPANVNLSPAALADYIRSSQLTQWFSVPSALTYMAKFGVVAFDDFPRLKRLIWCGEVLPTPVLTHLMQRLPHVTFTNLYGPTEATIASSFYTVPTCPVDERTAIPIGRPCDGEELLVLDEALEPVPTGELGNLYIRGVGLSSGYWGDPEKTRLVFLPNPRASDPGDRLYRTGDLANVGTDGQIYFHGRADSQIKSRGYRIELGEIEAALSSMECLREAGVVAVETVGFEGATICCAFVPALAASNVTPSAVRKALSAVLPSYMLPARWLVCDRLPKNSNGKVDRPVLKERFRQQLANASTAGARVGWEQT